MVKKILIIILVVFVLIQFYRPSKNNATTVPVTDFLKVTKANASISNMIKTSCYDCHSNHTNYPWYANIAPVSWVIAHHVDEGKEELNFSEWDTYSQKRKSKKLEDLIEVLDEREMPLKMYLPMHPKAKLTDTQYQELIAWTKSLQ